MKKVLITGATGQTASYLCDYILKEHKDYEIHCTRRWRSREENIWSFRDKVIWHNADLKDQFNTFHLIKEIKPERIFVYSANSYVRDSWIQPIVYLEENTSHLLNVMNSVLMLNDINIERLEVKLKYNPKIFIALSSEEYGDVEDGTIIKEEQPLKPVSPYGVSKVAADLYAFQYWKSYGLNVYRFRMFNNESPRRGQIFVTGSFVKQVVLMEKEILNPVLHVGDTSSVRDWSDSRDVVRATWEGLNKCEPGNVYNVCSGKDTSIDEFIERLKELSTIDFKIKVDKNRMRPSDVKWLKGDCTKFKKITGWKPKYDFIKDTVPEMMSYWRKRISTWKSIEMEEL